MSFNLTRQTLGRNVAAALARQQGRTLSTAALRPTVASLNRTTNVGSALAKRQISISSIMADGGHQDPPEDGLDPDQRRRMDL